MFQHDPISVETLKAINGRVFGPSLLKIQDHETKINEIAAERRYDIVEVSKEGLGEVSNRCNSTYLFIDDYVFLKY